MMPLTLKILAAVDKLFREEDRHAVAELLSTYGERPHEREAERVCLAILQLSKGDAARVRELVAAAKRDYRDVIAWAQQPLSTYVVGLLRKGPNWVPTARLDLALLRKWKEAGAVVIGGGFRDDGDMRGLYIFTVDSAEAAQALVDSDPAIQSGALVFEFHPWLAADNLQVGAPKSIGD
jgi:uncharacterized protein YciI